MDDPERARLRDEEDRELYAIRRAERELERRARELTDELEEFHEHEDEAEIAIEREWRKESWGHDPEREPAWNVKH